MYPGRKTTADTTRKLVRRFYDQFWNGHNYQAAERIVGPAASLQGTLGPSDEPGPHGFETYAKRLSAAFDELHMEILEMMVDRDRAAARIVWTGKHCGEILGHPASGHSVRHECVALFRTAHGRIVDVRIYGDLSALHRQLTAEGPREPAEDT